MTDKHSNEEFNFGSLASSFADEPAPKKEPAGPAKITRSNVTASAPAVEAAIPAVEQASAPALAPVPNTPMPPMPEVQNPAQTPGFWGSALASTLPTIGLGLLGGAALTKFMGGKGGQGAAAAPTVDENMRQLKLAQEQAKLDAIYAKAQRQQELHQANLAKTQPSTPAVTSTATPVAPVGIPSPQAYQGSGLQQPSMTYGQTTLNAPTGAPNVVGAPPPAEVPTKPIDPVAQARINAIAAAESRAQAAFEAEQRRKDAAELRAQQAHDAKIAKQNAAKLQANQGKPLSESDLSLVRKSEENKIDKANVAQQQAFAKQQAVISGAAVPPTVPNAPVELTPSPEVVAETQAPKPPEKAPKAKLPMPEGWGKGMSWLVNQHGVEGAQDYINRYNDGKPFATYDEMMKSYQENTMRPKYSDIPKDIRKSRGIAPPPQAGAAAGAALVPRTSLGSQQDLTQGGGAVLHMLNPLKF